MDERARQQIITDALLCAIERKDAELAAAKARADSLQRELARLRGGLEPCSDPRVERRPLIGDGAKEERR